MKYSSFERAQEVLNNIDIVISGMKVEMRKTIIIEVPKEQRGKAMANKINKEKTGLVVKTTVRLPKEYYDWLTELSNKSREEGNYKSMNDYVTEGVKLLKDKSIYQEEYCHEQIDFLERIGYNGRKSRQHR